MIDAVLFDFGGVMTSSPFENFATWEAAHDVPADTIRRINSTNPDTNAWAQLERSEVTPEEFDSLFAAEAAALGHEIPGAAVLECLKTELRPEMVRAAIRLHEDFTIAVLTNNFLKGDSAGVSMKSDVLSHFDAVIESSVVGVRKPDPEFYEVACREVGVPAERCVFLDDLGINLKPARALGMQTIKVLSAAQALTDLGAIVGIDLINLEEKS